MARMKMTDEQKAAAKRLRIAKAERMEWEARLAAADAAEEAKRIEKMAIVAERAAVYRRQAEALRKAEEKKEPAPSALALTRRRNAETRRVAAHAAHKAEEVAQAVAAEKAAMATIRQSNGETAPQPQSPARKARPIKTTLCARSTGWWDVVVSSDAGTFAVPFYQPERPEPREIAQAVREEITRRLAISQAKPRRTKAPAMPGRMPRESTKIRRIERQQEGV